MSRPYILGIDPGLSGALSLLDYTDPKKPAIRWLADMPLITLRERSHLDLDALAMEIDARAKEIAFAVIEDVGAMTYIDGGGVKRGQGAAASFAFGKAAGSVLGVLAACMVPTYSVKPAVWKILMGLSHRKNESRERAISLFPSHRESFRRQKDDGRAEATLLAVLGKERFSSRAA